MSPSEQRRHLRAAESAFRRRYPDKRVLAPHAFGDLARPALRQGDWLIIGVIGEDTAIELVQWLICVNTSTDQRRIVKGWEAAYALAGQGRSTSPSFPDSA